MPGKLSTTASEIPRKGTVKVGVMLQNNISLHSPWQNFDPMHEANRYSVIRAISFIIID